MRYDLANGMACVHFDAAEDCVRDIIEIITRRTWALAIPFERGA